MNKIRFGYVSVSVGLLAGITTMMACSSKTPDASGVGGESSATGGFGGVIGGNGGTPAAGGTVVGSGGTPISGNGGTPVGGGGTPPSSGGTSNTGGTSMVNVGGDTNVNDIHIVGTVTQCPGTTPTLPQGSLASCNLMGCSDAHCVPLADVPANEMSSTALLSKCPDGSICTPDDYIATDDQFLAKKCTSLLGAEGRCTSTCVTQVNQEIDQLPQDVCDKTERCAPCFNPIDGTDTKACSQGCDTGPANKTPVTFASCGNGQGLCVPKSLIPASLASSVPKDTCVGADSGPNDFVCAPTEKVKDLNYNFPACTSTALGYTLAAGVETTTQKGGCVPFYLAGANSGFLDEGDAPTPCAEPSGASVAAKNAYLCAPCVNPLSTPADAPTGACPAM
jgi:hypothetical protein